MEVDNESSDASSTELAAVESEIVR